MMTTDGATPSFHVDGVMDKCIQVALDAGVNPIDAYLMASFNVAKYYNLLQSSWSHCNRTNGEFKLFRR